MTADDSSDVPVYLRLRGLLSSAMLEGAYADGDQLPSVRAFASAHGANPLTVAKAYQSLQDDGYVCVRRGVGMFVADGAIGRLRHDERNRFLTHSWPRIRDHMSRIGVELRSLIEIETV